MKDKTQAALAVHVQCVPRVHRDATARAEYVRIFATAAQIGERSCRVGGSRWDPKRAATTAAGWLAEIDARFPEASAHRDEYVVLLLAAAQSDPLANEGARGWSGVAQTADHWLAISYGRSLPVTTAPTPTPHPGDCPHGIPLKSQFRCGHCEAIRSRVRAATLP